eukprot:GEMP01076301.1.p1 GENE.GEMP01076301.1~~GEMP01076301.1.p1  ORF type:complete len:101 (+),score=14.81 GEMP01076301.1:316-618(+)
MATTTYTTSTTATTATTSTTQAATTTAALTVAALAKEDSFGPSKKNHTSSDVSARGILLFFVGCVAIVVSSFLAYAFITKRRQQTTLDFPAQRPSEQGRP